MPKVENRQTKQKHRAAKANVRQQTVANERATGDTSSELAIRVEGTRLAKRAERASLSGRMGELGLTITPLGETPFPSRVNPSSPPCRLKFNGDNSFV